MMAAEKSGNRLPIKTITYYAYISTTSIASIAPIAKRCRRIGVIGAGTYACACACEALSPFFSHPIERRRAHG